MNHIIPLTDYSISFIHSLEDIQAWLGSRNYTRIAVLVDENTRQHCWPLLELFLDSPLLIEIPAGEAHKNLETCQYTWSQMLEGGLDRGSVLLNLGGGVVGDMGGFCAQTYMRGIDFVQIPTTLLAQVDASIGGKLGVDFQHYKNMVGLFADPEAVFIHLPFLETLAHRQLVSGYAEVVKHALVGDVGLWEELQSQPDPATVDWDKILPRAIMVKKRIVEADPLEKGLRQVLNFGHTVGHAIETWALSQGLDVLHGEAVAAGMIAETRLSHRHAGLPDGEMNRIVTFLEKGFPSMPIAPEVELWSIMRKDKKNRGGQIRMALLEAVGRAKAIVVKPGAGLGE
ncbi:MAG: 3-dehydroquinate synthase [Saprospirales bacterium]|nr:3-dehydroquinate synthase [Saprospirales bacterium]